MKIIPFVPDDPYVCRGFILQICQYFVLAGNFQKKILQFEISFITLSVLTIFEHLFKHILERKSLSVLGPVVAV